MSAPAWLGRVAGGYWLRVIGVSMIAAGGISVILRGLGGSFLTSFACAMIYAVVMGGLSAAALPAVVHRVPAERAIPRRLALTGSILVLAPVGTLVAAGMIAAIGLAGPGGLWGRFTDDLRIVAVVALAVATGMSLYESLRSRLEATTLELRTKQLEEERTRKLALEARLSSLESRLQPHFLFNTLNAISALIQENPDRAERIVERLAA